MRSLAISELWTARSADLRVEDFFVLAGRAPFALLYGDGPEGRWILHGEDPLLVLETPELPELRFDRRGEVPTLLPDFIGFIGYEFGYLGEPLLPAPPAPAFPVPHFHFALHRQVRLYDRQTGTLYEGLREMPGRMDAMVNALCNGPFAAHKTHDTDTAEGYCAKVSRIREEIARGNVYQANLTRQERWAFEGDLTQFARRLYEANPAPFSAFIAGPDFSIVSSSPERFLRVANGRIETRPIKGTAPRGADVDTDARLAAELLASPKNRSELAMITDLLRNDLTRVCQVPSVRVEAFPVLESYANVHHLVATVSGALKPDLDLKGLLEGVFPGGSITGCPKLAAMQLIRELEEAPRQVYTGALGWFTHDLSQLDFNIPIRTAWASREELLFGVGGGVVWDSDPQDEYLETIHKGRSIVQCLS
jgi:anthranilate/para-aminobenzoate synthase component I